MMEFYRSEIINITRYKNATFVKLTASASGFVSYDFEPEDGSGTFTPEEITIRATYGGNLHFGKWEYSRDGETWEELTDGKGGVIVAASGLTVPASSSLFSLTNSAITFRCVADDGESADTYTLTREVDPLQVYRKSSAGISNLADKVSLIATDEELKRFTTAETFYSKYAEFSVGMGEFRQTVTGTYATKKYADDAADAAEASAKGYADDAASTAETNAKEYAEEYAEQNYVKVEAYNTKMQQTDRAISTHATAITGLSEDIVTKASVFSKATPPTASGDGATDGDLWIDTAHNNEVYRYDSTSDEKWIPVVDATAIVSQINQTADEISINADKININGAISANGNFKITPEGNLEAENGVFSGTINVGGNDNGRVNVYDSDNELSAALLAGGIAFYKNGSSYWFGTTKDIQDNVYYTQTHMTDGWLRFRYAMTEEGPYNTMLQFGPTKYGGLNASNGLRAGLTFRKDMGFVIGRTSQYTGDAVVSPVMTFQYHGYDVDSLPRVDMAFNANISGNVEIAKKTTLIGDTTIHGNLTAEKAISAKTITTSEGLTVGGAATIQNNLTATGNITSYGIFKSKAVKGNVTALYGTVSGGWYRCGCLTFVSLKWRGTKFTGRKAICNGLPPSAYATDINENGLVQIKITPDSASTNDSGYISNSTLYILATSNGLTSCYIFAVYVNDEI